MAEQVPEEIQKVIQRPDFIFDKKTKSPLTLRCSKCGYSTDVLSEVAGLLLVGCLKCGSNVWDFLPKRKKQSFSSEKVMIRGCPRS